MKFAGFPSARKKNREENAVEMLHFFLYRGWKGQLYVQEKAALPAKLAGYFVIKEAEGRSKAACGKKYE